MKIIKIIAVVALMLSVSVLASGCASCATGDCGAPVACSPCGR